MSLLHSLAQSVGFIEFVFRRQDTTGDIFPSDAVGGVLAGERPFGILVVGESTAMGLGVATHALGPAAQTARRVARLTGRGVSWSTIGFPSSRLRDAPAITADASNFAGVEVVIVMAGIVDTLCMTPVAEWKRGMRALLDDQELDSRGSTGAVYWEGLSELLDDHGRRVGRGYLEMTGYAARLQL